MRLMGLRVGFLLERATGQTLEEYMQVSRFHLPTTLLRSHLTQPAGKHLSSTFHDLELILPYGKHHQPAIHPLLDGWRGKTQNDEARGDGQATDGGRGQSLHGVSKQRCW